MLRGVPNDLAVSFLDACLRKDYPVDTTILHQGETSPGLFMVAQGQVEIASVDPAGHQSILHNAGPGDILGEMEALTQRENIASCVARADAVALFCPRSTLVTVLQDTTMIQAIVRIFHDRLREANAQILRTQFLPVEDQIYACLARLSMHSPIIRHSQAYVADMAGCSRQSANRILGELRDEGIVALRKGAIEILDRDALLRIYI